MCINYDGNTFTAYIPPCASCDCAMRRDNSTNRRTDLVHSIYTQLWSSWKPEESLSSKYFSIIVCVPKQQLCLRKQWQHLLCLVCSLWGASHLWKLLHSVASPIFLVIFSATVYQEETILFSLTLFWCFIGICLKRYSSFVHKFNSSLCMESVHTLTLVKGSCVLSLCLLPPVCCVSVAGEDSKSLWEHEQGCSVNVILWLGSTDTWENETAVTVQWV